MAQRRGYSWIDAVFWFLGIVLSVPLLWHLIERLANGD
jgi:hypothetical protein